jgi:hypothetical protein
VAVIALQGALFGLHHVREGPVHFGFDEAVVTAEVQAGLLCPQPQGLWPVEVAPEATFS